MNTSKTEVVRFSKSTFLEGSVILNDESIHFVPEAKCLGVWWNHNLSAYKSVNENICKARRAFFVFGKMHAFHGHLNPLSAISIYKTCVLPVLLYGSDTWLLDSSSIDALERFQYEIGRKILRLPHFFSGTVTRLCLELPSIASLILLRKLLFLSKLLTKDSSSHVSSRILSAGIITDPLNVSIIQQCKMLESRLQISESLVDKCLEDPDTADCTTRICRNIILDHDRQLLFDKAKHHPEASIISQISNSISWLNIWDRALDYVSGVPIVFNFLLKFLPIHPSKVPAVLNVTRHSLPIS